MSELRKYMSASEGLSVRMQCELLEINRITLYYDVVDESEENLQIMRLMDEEFIEYPTQSVLQMQDFLLALSYTVNAKRVRRLLRKMGIMAHYPSGI